MDQVKDVDIEPNGVFKYILIKLTPKGSQAAGASKVVVRGYSWADYHADILDRVSPKFHQLGLTYDCLGGGRIDHDSSNKKIKIYGYSVGFGQADHHLTQVLLNKEFQYPEGNITWSNAGY